MLKQRGNAIAITAAAVGFKMKYEIIKDYLPKGSDRRSGQLMPSVEFDVAHDTGNPGSTDEGNVGFYERTAYDASASAHIFCDDNSIRECIPLLTGPPEKAWHNRYLTVMDNLMYGFNANDRAASVELCFGGKIDFKEAYKRYIWVHAYICYKFDLNPAKDIVGHETLDPGRKIDPSNGLKTGGVTYREFIADVIKEYNECTSVETPVIKAPVVKINIPEFHTIIKGDTFWSIAQKYEGLTVNDIMNFNKNINPADLKLGQKICLKASAVLAPIKPIKDVTYVVKKGDTFWGIASKIKDVSMEDIIKWNRAIDPTNLQVGQVITLKEPAVIAPIKKAPAVSKPKIIAKKYPLATKVLRRGNKGTDVLNMQKALCAAYYYPDKKALNNGCDGSFGPDTEDAVKRFQSVRFGKADGVFDSKTRLILDKIVNK